MCWGKNSARTMLRDRKGVREKKERKREREKEARRKRENHRIEIVRERDAHGQNWRCLAWALLLVPETGMTLPLCISLM